MRHHRGFEIGRAVSLARGKRAVLLAFVLAAGTLLAAETMAVDSARRPPGRPVAGNGLSHWLGLAPKEEPAAVATAPSPGILPAATTPVRATAALQQPGFLATGETVTVGAAAYNPTPQIPTPQSGAAQHTPAASQPNAIAATRAPAAPDTGLRSLWNSFIGAGAVPPPRPGRNASRQPSTGQIPLPDIAAAPASTGPGKAVSSLFGQIAGTAPAANRPLPAPPAAPIALPPVTPPAVAPAIPDIKLASGERATEKPPVHQTANTNAPAAPAAPTPTAANSQPYPVTAARSNYPQGSIPTPDPLATIASAVAKAGQEGSALSGLWRPVTMAKDGSPHQSPNQPAFTPPSLAAAPQPSAAATATTTGGESKFASLMLQPFHATNGAPAATNSGTPSPASLAANGAGKNLENTIRASALLQQLSMSTHGDPYSPSQSLAESTPPPPPPSRLLRDGQMTTGSIDPAVLAAVASGTASDAELVAFLQELAPEPADLDIDTGAEREALENEEAAEAGGEDADKSLAEAEKLGTEPEDTSLQFLRTETVLLKPGESQCDVGIQYLFTENEFPILLTDQFGNIVGVDEVVFRARELSVPLEYRVGLLPKVQGFVGASVGWANTQLAFDALDVFENDGGLGDIYFGLTTQLADASANCPYVIASFTTIAPTGGDPFIGAIGFSPSVPSLGEGFWSVAGNVLCIQPYDPVVIFYGVGMKYLFERDFLGAEFEPGTQYIYQMGVGFAVNERITLSTRFFGSYIEEFRVNDIRRFGTNAEPMSIRLSATISKPCDRFLEPFVEFGITDDAVSSFFGITYTY